MRNRATEKDVRDYLTRRGCRGDIARFDYLDLFAIERPGWIQVFKFCVQAFDNDGDSRRFFGVVRDDQRSSTKIHLAHTEKEQSRVADAWSAGLITSRRRPLGTVQWILLAVFGTFVAIALLGALF
jgi:hypothetical protein